MNIQKLYEITKEIVEKGGGEHEVCIYAEWGHDLTYAYCARKAYVDDDMDETPHVDEPVLIIS